MKLESLLVRAQKSKFDSTPRGYFRGSIAGLRYFRATPVRIPEEDSRTRPSAEVLTAGDGLSKSLVSLPAG